MIFDVNTYGAPGTGIVYNVKLWGARGDGVTNDREAIKACFEQASSGDTIIFPPGEYLISPIIKGYYDSNYPSEETLKTGAFYFDSSKTQIMVGSEDYIYEDLTILLKDPIEGYYKASDDTFYKTYEEETYSDPITGVFDVLFIDKLTTKKYIYKIKQTNPTEIGGYVIHNPYYRYTSGAYVNSTNQKNGNIDILSLWEKDNVSIVFDDGAILRQDIVPGAFDTYVGGRWSSGVVMMHLHQCNNCKVINATLIGDYVSRGDAYKTVYPYNNTYGYTGDNAVGLRITGCIGCEVKHCDVSEVYGDSVAVYKYHPNDTDEIQSERIIVDDCNIHDSCRNGVTFDSSKDSILSNTIISRILGGSPKSGVDVEPQSTYSLTENLLIKNCIIEDCLKSVISAGKGTAITIDGCQFDCKLDIGSRPVLDPREPSRGVPSTVVAAPRRYHDWKVNLRGTVGVDATIPDLPESGMIKGDTYRVVSDGSYGENVSAVVGDHFYYNGNTWEHVNKIDVLPNASSYGSLIITPMFPRAGSLGEYLVEGDILPDNASLNEFYWAYEAGDYSTEDGKTTIHLDVGDFVYKSPVTNKWTRFKILGEDNIEEKILKFEDNETLELSNPGYIGLVTDGSPSRENFIRLGQRDSTIKGYYYNGEFWSNAGHTSRISPTADVVMYYDQTSGVSNPYYYYHDGAYYNFYSQLDNYPADPDNLFCVETYGEYAENLTTQEDDYIYWSSSDNQYKKFTGHGYYEAKVVKLPTYENYQKMIEALNNMGDSELLVGQSVNIEKSGLVSFKVISIESTYVEYIYTSDSAITTPINQGESIQFGYYTLTKKDTETFDVYQFDYVGVVGKIKLERTSDFLVQNTSLTTVDCRGYGKFKNCSITFPAIYTCESITFENCTLDPSIGRTSYFDIVTHNKHLEPPQRYNTVTFPVTMYLGEDSQSYILQNVRFKGCTVKQSPVKLKRGELSGQVFKEYPVVSTPNQSYYVPATLITKPDTNTVYLDGTSASALAYTWNPETGYTLVNEQGYEDPVPNPITGQISIVFVRTGFSTIVDNLTYEDCEIYTSPGTQDSSIGNANHLILQRCNLYSQVEHMYGKFFSSMGLNAPSGQDIVRTFKMTDCIIDLSNVLCQYFNARLLWLNYDSLYVYNNIIQGTMPKYKSSPSKGAQNLKSFASYPFIYSNALSRKDNSQVMGINNIKKPLPLITDLYDVVKVKTYEEFYEGNV